MFLASCFSIALASCCHVSRREPKGAERRLLDAKQGQPQHKKKQVQLVLPGTFIFPVDGCKQENSQQRRSSFSWFCPGPLRDVSTKQKLAASKVSPKTRKEEAASVGFARDNTGRESERHDPGRQAQTRPRSRRHSI